VSLHLTLDNARIAGVMMCGLSIKAICNVHAKLYALHAHDNKMTLFERWPLSEGVLKCKVRFVIHFIKLVSN